MSGETTDYEVLNVVLDELDIKAQYKDETGHDESYWVCQRRHTRHPFRVPCTIRFLPSGSFTVSTLPGRTRNLSRNGLSLVVRRVFFVGDPVEVEVSLPGRPRMFMGGLVTFCRYAGRGYHELGVALKASSPEPIFSRSPMLAVRTLEWLAPDEKTN